MLRRTSSLLIALATALAPALGARSALAQQPVIRGGPPPQQQAAPPANPTPPGIRHEIIRGRVTDDSAHAIAGATVTVTMAPERNYQQATTDSSGSYQIDWAQGTGDYLVHAAATGRKTFRKRITRNGPDTIYVVNITLESNVQKLEAVKVTAQQAPKPDRNTGFMMPQDPGSDERTQDGVNGAVAPEDAGNLAALAATLPGVATTPSGISVLGLAPSQNSTTLNGMNFGGTDVPRDAQKSVRVATSSYDPSRGWFSGAQTAVDLSIGNLFANRTAHVTLDAPALQATDAISQKLGGKLTNAQLSIGGDGTLHDDRFAYNYGIDAGRRYSNFASLGTADADLLQHAGVSADSVARLEQILAQVGVPLRTGAVPSTRATDRVSAIGRIDLAPYDWNTFEAAKTTYGLLGYAGYTHSGALAIGPVSTAAQGGEARQTTLAGQALWSTYWHHDWLSDAMTGVTLADSRNTPYLALPSGSVLVASDFNDGTAGLNTLQFGGGTLNSRKTQWTWETTTHTQFYARGRRTHRVAFAADSRLDAVRDSTLTDALGSFGYNSLGDVANGTPSSFSRTLSSPERKGAEWNGFAALGDYWRITDKFQLLYGARVEGNRFTERPAYNPAVAQAFGVRTDAAPNSFAISPRVGFTWLLTGDNRNGYMVNQFGSFILHQTHLIRGGFGEFRNMLAPDLLANASASTGLPNGSQQLTCIGSAVPTPDWSAYLADPASVPTTCANGAPSSFGDVAPSVETFDPKFRPSTSWRGNLAYGSQIHDWTYSLEGVYSYNIDQPGVQDLNFANTRQFALADEGNRPIFVPPSSIVPSSGAVSPVASRRTSAFGRVVQNVSDLHSVSRQLTLSLQPGQNGPSRWYTSFAYTLGDITAQRRGFDGATFGSPTAIERAPGDYDIRHQFLVQAGYSKWGVSLTMFGRLQSGMPFTPMVGGDINGDGLANDRAFIFDPDSVSDPALKSQLQSLLAGSPKNVRDCLTAQMDKPAARNSCRGPWTTSMNARLDLSGRRLHFGDRLDLSINFTNPLGGIDQLLHGNNLRGWGTAAMPDPVLFRPVGFDPNANRFTYEVNPRFGNTRPSATTLRAPFRMTIDFRMDIGKPLGQQQLDRWLNPGRGGRKGPKLTPMQLKQRYSRNVPDPYAGILEESDSLLLTRDQVEQLQRADTVYKARMDSLWTELSDYLGNLPDEFDSKDALKRQEDATDAAWELSRQEMHEVLPKILTPVQLKLLPWPASMLYNAKEPVHIRMFTG